MIVAYLSNLVQHSARLIKHKLFLKKEFSWKSYVRILQKDWRDKQYGFSTRAVLIGLLDRAFDES